MNRRKWGRENRDRKKGRVSQRRRDLRERQTERWRDLRERKTERDGGRERGKMER